MSKIVKAFRSAVLSLALAFATLPTLTEVVSAAEEINIVDGYAVHGYDVVAYFTEGKPVPGNNRYTAKHDGATYRFASAAHRDAFAANPAKYAPQYGGYCAFGTAMGRKFDGDPQAWAIVDDKLYLNLNSDVQSRWKQNIPGFIKGAENNWPLIRSLADASLEASAPAGVTLGAQ
jgi:YHS domain-containing protein